MVRSEITFFVDSGTNGPEDLKYLKLHQQTTDLAGITHTVTTVTQDGERAGALKRAWTVTSRSPERSALSLLSCLLL